MGPFPQTPTWAPVIPQGLPWPLTCVHLVPPEQVSTPSSGPPETGGDQWHPWPHVASPSTAEGTAGGPPAPRGQPWKGSRPPKGPEKGSAPPSLLMGKGQQLSLPNSPRIEVFTGLELFRAAPTQKGPEVPWKGSGFVPFVQLGRNSEFISGSQAKTPLCKLVQARG